VPSPVVKRTGRSAVGLDGEAATGPACGHRAARWPPAEPSRPAHQPAAAPGCARGRGGRRGRWPGRVRRAWRWPRPSRVGTARPRCRPGPFPRWPRRWGPARRRGTACRPDPSTGKPCGRRAERRRRPRRRPGRPGIASRPRPGRSDGTGAAWPLHTAAAHLGRTVGPRLGSTPGRERQRVRQRCRPPSTPRRPEACPAAGDRRRPGGAPLQGVAGSESRSRPQPNGRRRPPSHGRHRRRPPPWP